MAVRYFAATASYTALSSSTSSAFALPRAFSRSYSSHSAAICCMKRKLGRYTLGSSPNILCGLSESALKSTEPLEMILWRISPLTGSDTSTNTSLYPQRSILRASSSVAMSPAWATTSPVSMSTTSSASLQPGSLYARLSFLLNLYLPTLTTSYLRGS